MPTREEFRGRVDTCPALRGTHPFANVARLFATIHACNYCVGDINQNNILVKLDGTVAAIDVDSFQIGDGHRFKCGVATELYLPPELKSMDLLDIGRTRDHDAFGLAVLLFQLLFMGRHPHAGRYLGRGEMPIEQAIAESRFAYSRHSTRTRMAPPPHTPPLEALGPLGDLFERAFAPPNTKRPRPTTDEWLAALTELRSALMPCKSVAWHHHHRALSHCPRCAIEASSKAKLFGGVLPKPQKVLADLATLMRRVEIAPRPRPMPTIPVEADWRSRQPRTPWSAILYHPLPTLVAFGGLAALSTAAAQPIERSLILIGAGAVAILAAAISWPRQRAPQMSIVKALAAEQEYNAAVAALAKLRPDAVHETQRQKIFTIQADLDDLGALRPDIQAASPFSEAEERERYLARHVIEKARLFNIGPARCAVLRSWGIETAADIDEAKLDEIPGFGRNLRDRLVAWKDGLERAFVNVPMALNQQPRDREDFDREVGARRIKLMGALGVEIDTYIKLLAEMDAERGAASQTLASTFERKMEARIALGTSPQSKAGLMA